MRTSAAIAWIALLSLPLSLLAGCSGDREDVEVRERGTATEERAADDSSGTQAGAPDDQGNGYVPTFPSDGSDEMLLDDDERAAGAPDASRADAGVFAGTWRVGGRFDRTALGDPDAPVLIEAYSDWPCDSCGSYYWDAVEVWVEMVATGIARYEFIHFPLERAASAFAANAAECAADQGGFWQFHDRLFRWKDMSYYEPEGATALAAELGMDADEFARCIAEQPHDGRIRAEAAAARAAGIPYARTIRINGKAVQHYGADSLIDAVKIAADQAALR